MLRKLALVFAIPILVIGVPLVSIYTQEENPHEGQPSHCTNAKDAPKAHKCECMKEER